MKYLEKSPSPRLATHVKCFWSLESSFAQCGEHPEPVVPDACVEIVFDLADRFRRYHADGKVELQPTSIVAGQIEKNILIGPSGRVRLFGIRFHPTGASPFINVEMSAITNRIEPLDAIWGNRVTELEDKLFSAATFEEQIAVAETALIERFDERVVIDKTLAKAIEAISTTNGAAKVHHIAKNAGISERGLERRFARYIGLSPKSFSRIVRFQRVLQSIESSPRADILDTAYRFGYYDQSHLINDFKRYTGMSPSLFAEKSHGITELFIGAE